MRFFSIDLFKTAQRQQSAYELDIEKKVLVTMPKKAGSFIQDETAMSQNIVLMQIVVF